MTKLSALSVILAMLVISAAAFGQAANDPKMLALDIHLGIKRETLPETLALKIQTAISYYRLPCERVSDYQLFEVGQNITNLKVKCAGSDLYGLTVASNGYLSVYGGNGMIAGMDPRDGPLYSFGLSGEVVTDGDAAGSEGVSGTVSRLAGDSLLSPLYILLFFAGVIILVGLFAAITLFLWRKQKSDKEALQEQHLYRVSRDTKDVLMRESRQIHAFLYRHPAGVYIVRGKSGHRRFFRSIIGAYGYRFFRWRLFETSPPKPLA